MPWNNQNGSGGGWKGNGGPWGNGEGPWGGGGQGKGGGQPPDLEELLRRSQDQIKTIIPRGGGFFIPVIIFVALFALWLFKSVYMIQPDELGVELIFGKPKDSVSEQGLHFHWWPIEKVEIVRIRENKVAVPVTGNSHSLRRNASLMLSADQNIVDVEFTVIWRVSSPKNFLFNVQSPEDFVRSVSESAMREYVGRSSAEDVRTDRRQELEDNVKRVSQSILDSFKAGITILSVQLERADPPSEVADAFEEVQRAQQDQDKFQQEAQAYSNKRLGDARGKVAQIREQSKAYRERVIAEADGEAQRFVSVYDQYVKAKDVTRKRLYLETLERVLKDSNKIVIEKNGSGVVPYLPLTEINKRAQGASQ